MDLAASIVDNMLFPFRTFYFETDMSAKDFGPIESDYAFFMAHATEAESDVAEYARKLTGFADGRTTIHMLDFGCGCGDFTERLLSCLNWPTRLLELTLIEPVRPQLAEAARRLARFSDQPISIQQKLPDGAGRQFDLILSNHVLYYVGDLDATLRQFVAALAPNGALLLAIAGWDNLLMELWTAGFEMLGEEVPYHAADDVAAALSRLGTAFEQTKCPCRLQFPDSTENRLKILRFLFADHLRRIPVDRLLSKFDRFARGSNIVVDTHSDHFVLRGR